MIACFLVGAMWFGRECADRELYEQRHKAYVAFSCVLLGLQSGLRDVSVGPDTIQYGNRYEIVSLKSWDSIFTSIKNYYFEGNTGDYKDPVYDLLEKTFQAVGLDYRAWLVFVAIAFFVAFGYFLYKNTSRVSDVCFALVLYMIIYYGFYSVTGLRQTLAMAVCLWAFEAAKRRKLLVFILLVLIASSIHKSAILFFPAYLLIDFKHPKKILGIAILLIPAIYVLRFEITGFIGSAMGYEEYADSFEGAGASGYAILSLAAAAATWWKCDDVLKERDEARSYVSLFAVSVFTIPALWVDPSIMRVVQYYSIFILPLFPMVLRALENGFAKGRNLRVSFSEGETSAGSLEDSGVGHLYLLCLLLLLAYCLKRFVGYSYAFFFMGN